MRSWLVVLLVAVACLSSAALAAKDPKDCEVCKKGMQEIFDSVPKEKRSRDAFEVAVEKYCAKINKAKAMEKEKKLCYFIEPVKRDVATPMANGVPVDRICPRLKKQAIEICEIKYDEKIDLTKVDLNTLRVKQLKQILADSNIECTDCIEKTDFIRKIEATITKKKDL